MKCCKQTHTTAITRNNLSFKMTLERTESLLAVTAFNRRILGEAYNANNVSAGRHAIYSTAKDQSFLLLLYTFYQEAVRVACILALSGLT